MPIAETILPIAALILAGWAAVATGLVPRDRWSAVEGVSFRILIPAMLISAIARADLSAKALGPLALTMIAALCAAGLAVLAMRAVVTRELLPDRRLSSLFQSVTRWNGFIALAVAERAAGNAGVLMIAVSMAVMIPLINVANIVVLAALGPGEANARRIVQTIAKNPLVIGCAIGLLLNVTGLGLPGAAGEAVAMLGRAALPVGVICVGAGLSLRRLAFGGPLALTATAIRLVAVPALFVLLGNLAGLDPLAMMAGTLVCAVPAATNGYVVAREMGGDAELYADILAWQTVLALLTMPAWLWFIG